MADNGALEEVPKFLTVNNYEIPCAVESAPEHSDDILGSQERAFSGKLLSNIRARPRKWSITTVPMAPIPGRMLIELVRGRGHAWNFRKEEVSGNYVEEFPSWLYSSQDLVPRSVTGSVSQFDDGVVGTKALRVSPSSRVQWPVFDPVWSVVAVVRGIRQDQWFTVVETWRGGKRKASWQNGQVFPATRLFEETIENEALTFHNHYAESLLVDELIYLPFEVDLSFVLSHYTWGQSYSPLPSLQLDGTMVDEIPVLVEGAGWAAENIPFQDENGFHNGLIIEIEFIEVL